MLASTSHCPAESTVRAMLETATLEQWGFRHISKVWSLTDPAHLSVPPVLPIYAYHPPWTLWRYCVLWLLSLFAKHISKGRWVLKSSGIDDFFWSPGKQTCWHWVPHLFEPDSKSITCFLAVITFTSIFLSQVEQGGMFACICLPQQLHRWSAQWAASPSPS